MRVDFFEEYPEARVLDRARLIDFPSTVFLAAPNLAGFRRIRDRLPWNVAAGYWPVLPSSYWLSPFTDRAEIVGLARELDAKDAPEAVLLDLELPILRPGLAIRNGRGFSEARRAIEDLLVGAAANGVQLLTAEYPVLHSRMRPWLEKLGISYSIESFPHKKVPMAYSSVFRFRILQTALLADIGSLSARHPGCVAVGLGCLATGAFGNEPILKPAALRRDLETMASLGVDHVILFRLGGLDEAYASVLRDFADQSVAIKKATIP